MQRPLRQRLGQNIQVLYRAHFQQDEAAKTTESVFVLDDDTVLAAEDFDINQESLNENVDGGW